MAGYSRTPLAAKIGIKSGHIVLLDNAPRELDLGETGDASLLRRLPREADACLDVTLTFHTSYDALADRLPVLFQRTTPAGMVWVCWPKKAAQKARDIDSDLDEGRVRALGLELGFVDVKVAAIDDTWSGLKFVRRLADR